MSILNRMLDPSPSEPPEDTADECPNNVSAARTCCFLFQLLDCDRPWIGGSRLALEHTDEVTIGRGDVCEVIRDTVAGARRLALTHSMPTLSTRHARLLRASNQWAIQDRGSHNGTWLNGRRIDYAELRDSDIFQVGRCFYLFRRYSELTGGDGWQDVTQQTLLDPLPSLGSLSPQIAVQNTSLRAVAKSTVPVLILGSTGTGKELAAKAVHQLSGRSGQFCAVNCGAIPTNLVESTLFGHIKGAFSGALSNQLGLIRSANQGTLFLDEIGDLALEAQASLLRVLQEREVLPVGGTQAIAVEFRVVAATHRPLEQLISQQLFRADLYARIAGHVHSLPPLTSRLEDFGPLFSQFWRRSAGNQAENLRLTTDAGWALLRHHWPLNVRELEQAIARAAVLGISPLSAEHFPFVLEHLPKSTSSIRLKASSIDTALRDQLDQLMRQHKGNVAAVARALGKGPTQIQRWLKKAGLIADLYRE